MISSLRTNPDGSKTCTVHVWDYIFKKDSLGRRIPGTERPTTYHGKVEVHPYSPDAVTKAVKEFRSRLAAPGHNLTRSRKRKHR